MRFARACSIGLAALAATAVAQPDPASSTPIPFEQLPAALKLGVRVEYLRQSTKVIREVVLVPDEWSFAEAIAHWTPDDRFPVLIDDGTRAATEQIGQFVRAFQPTRVVHWGSGQDTLVRDVRSTVESALARAWSAEDLSELPAQLVAIGHTPPGVVFAGEGDPAWTAALALAAGRGQPIAWIDAPRGVNGIMQSSQLNAVLQQVQQAVEQTGLDWRGLGDHIDAVTLCLNMPSRYDPAAGSKDEDLLATTDRVGRHAGTDDSADRWAWCGQVFGESRDAAWMAMCALYLSPERALLFDGYADTPPWNAFDATEAAKPLRQAEIEPLLYDGEHASARTWRAMATRPLDVGLVLINSQGGARRFGLREGAMVSGDVPVLTRPAIVHMVHSWSATRPLLRSTIAGRWLERGAFAYVGSVAEPYLQAFVPTPAVAGRLAAGAPLAAAARIDRSPAWKITIIGDPLLTIGHRWQDSDAPLPLTDVQDLRTPLRGAVEQERYVEALGLLVRLGYDDRAVRLVRSVTGPDVPLSPELAAGVLPAAFRQLDRALVREAYTELPSSLASDPALLDVLWLTHATILEAGSDRGVIRLLRTHLRGDQIAEDAEAVAKAIARVDGPLEARRFLQGVIDGVESQGVKRSLQRVIREYQPGRR